MEYDDVGQYGFRFSRMQIRHSYNEKAGRRRDYQYVFGVRPCRAQIYARSVYGFKRRRDAADKSRRIALCTVRHTLQFHPSTVDTPLVQTLFKDPARKAERLGEVPLGRLCSVQDVANAVLFLSGDEAAFINGLAMTVDGGVTCY